MTDFFISNLDFVFFVYGLCYLLTAVVTLSLPPKGSSGFRWDLFGSFCSLMALVAWLNWLALAFGDADWFCQVRLAVLTLSFAALVEFGRTSLGALGISLRARWFYPALLFLLGSALVALPDAVRVIPLNTLGIAAGGLSALTFWRGAIRQRDTRYPLWMLSATMLAFTVTLGLFAMRAPFFQVNVINQDTISSSFETSLLFARVSLALLTAVAVVWYYSRYNDAEAHRERVILGAPFRRRLILHLFGILGVGLLLTQETGRAQFEQILNEWRSRARMGAAALEFHDLNRMLDADPEIRRSEHESVRDELRRLHLACPDISALTLCTSRDNCVEKVAFFESGNDFETDFGSLLIPESFLLSEIRDLGNNVHLHRFANEQRALIETDIQTARDSKSSQWVLVFEVNTAGWRTAVASARALPLGLTLFFAIAFVALSLARQRAKEISRRALMSEERYRTLVESAPTGILLMDAEGRILSVNHSAEQILGRRRTELEGQSFPDMWPNGGGMQVRGALERASSGERVEVDLWSAVEGDRSVGCRAVFSRIPDESGIVTRIVGILTDITEQHEAHEEARRSEERYQQLFDDSLVGNYISSPDGRIWLCNQRFADILGFDSPREVMSYSAYGFYSDREQRTQFLRLIEQEKRVELYESELVRRDGKRITVLENVVGRFDTGGRLISLQGTLLDITERKQVQEELHNALEMVRAVIDASPYAVLMVDTAARVKVWNAASENMFGWGAGEVLEKPLPILLESDRSAHEEIILHTLAGNVCLDLHVHPVRRDGSTFDASVSTAPVYGPDGGVIGLVAIIADITESVYAQRALRQSEERYRSLADASPDAISLIDLTGTILWCNPQKARMYGYDDPAELIGTNSLQLLAPEDRSKAGQILADVLAGRDGRRHELSLLRRDGSRFVGEFRVVPLRDEEGTVSSLLTIAQDVTERNRAAEALRMSEERYRRIIETAQEGVWMLDVNGRTTFVNRTMAELLGVPAEEMPNRLLTEFLDIEQGSAQQGFPAGDLYQSSSRSDFRLRRHDGEERWVILRATPIQFDTAGPEGILLMVTDITDRKRAERVQEVLLKISEATSESTDLKELLSGIRTLLSELLDTTNFYVALYDEKTDEYSFEFFADEFDDMAVGERRKLPHSLTDYVRRRGIALLADERTFDELVAQGEVQLIGTPSPVWLGVPLRTARGVVGVMAIQSYTDSQCYDVQDREVLSVVSGHVAMAIERKRALEALFDSQEQLRQSQKMEAIGRLAGGVAHDFNNLLTGILGYSEITMHLLGTDSPLRENIEQIARSAERAATLTRQLLAFSRKQLMQPRVLCLNDVVSDMHKMLRRLIGEDIELEVELSPELGNVLADPGQIEQVILNLAVNARDAMPQGGRLVIETKNVELASSPRRELADLAPGEYVMLSIRDTGTGIPPEVLPNIFEPFFTTKERGKGTGLGLSTVYGIVAQSGGRIAVDSELGEGACFRVYLPRTFASPESEREDVLTAGITGGTETILLVEDEDHVRRLIERQLRERGYNVYAAEDATQALDLVERYGRAIELLLTDVVMPQMSGLELAELLMETYPNLRVLFISGYADEAARLSETRFRNAAFLAKPFAADALGRKLRELLDREPAPQ